MDWEEGGNRRSRCIWELARRSKGCLEEDHESTIGERKASLIRRRVGGLDGADEGEMGREEEEGRMGSETGVG